MKSRRECQRNTGKLLKQMEKNKGGGDTSKHRSHDATGAPRLKDLGIKKDQSVRWQIAKANGEE